MSDKAFKWIYLAAQQNFPEAQNNLGLFYAGGKGIAPDYDEAFKWIRLAAEQNSAEAQVNLGILYEYNPSEPNHNTEAKKWYGKACANGLQQGCEKYKELSMKGY